jgi:hypothetical protein
VLTRYVPPALVDEVLVGCGAVQQRFRLLPARFGMYFVLGLCLFSHLGYDPVIREILSGLEAPLRAAGWGFPSATALSRLRRRLGPEPFERLFARLTTALSPGTEPWSHICGLLAVAWDATTLNVAPGPENIAAFGRQRAAAFPQARLVTLIACGTRALLAAAPGPRTQGERALAASLLGALRPGMLLLADRGFYSYRLWRAAAATRAHLCWRVKGNLHLPVVRTLPDGSYLTILATPKEGQRRSHRDAMRRRRGRQPPGSPLPAAGTPARVIEFTLTITAADGSTRTEPYRLITTLTSPAAAPAAILATGYAWRWACETGFAEFKTYLRGPGRVLRPKTPALVYQEIWAYLILYQAIRAIICLAAATAGLDPGQISFTTTLHATRRTLATARTHPRQALHEIQTTITSTRQLIPARPGRIRARAVAHHSSSYPALTTARKHGPITQHATHTLTIHPPTTPPHTPHHHHKQPTTQQPDGP